MIDAIRQAVLAEADDVSFPSASVELLLMCFNVHKRSGPDNPKVSEIRVFAVQGFVRCLMVESRVRGSIAQVRSFQE